MTHPLTDDMIEEIQIRFGGACYECYDDMRGAYDLAVDHIQSLVDSKHTALYKTAYGTSCYIEFFFDEVLEDLRSQQQEDN